MSRFRLRQGSLYLQAILIPADDAEHSLLR